MKYIGIIGSRRRDSFDDARALRDTFLSRYEEGDRIVSGGCTRGGDKVAEQLARQYQVPILIHYARWDKLGKRAGFARNNDIAEDASVLIAQVARDRTGGTEDTIKKFKQFHPGAELIII